MPLTIKLAMLIILAAAAFLIYTRVFTPFLELGKDKVGYFHGNISEPAVR